PDGPLWYLPFELLPIGDRDGPLLGESTMVQYAPTPGLAIQPAAEPATLRTLGVAAGRFFAPADLDANQSKIESLMQALDPAVRLPSEPPVPGSLLGNQIGHLLVASARGMDPANPLEFSVASYDASSPQGSLKSWLRFPAASPRTVVLAGFRSAVASGKMGDGSEVFLTLCGLHAAGVREVMLSRWPVGGESTVIGVRELAQEVPFIGMAKGWQRARKILSQTELAPSEEPMLTKEESKLENLTGNEPFFWSSYLVSAALEKEGQP
ncbi:MAG: CHAT domain-containing protein, partial [Planctomycetota bacterium]